MKQGTKKQLEARTRAQMDKEWDKLSKREQQMSNYPEPHRQYHSYGFRYWNGAAANRTGRWMYWGSKFYQGKGKGRDYRPGQGWREQWIEGENRCWTTTDLLQAQLKAQGVAHRDKVVIEVVRFIEPTVEWVAWHGHRALLLEDPEVNRARLSVPPKKAAREGKSRRL